MPLNSAPRQPADDVALRHQDAPHRRPARASARASRRASSVVAGEGLLLQVIDALLQRVHRRPVVIDHRVDDAMEAGPPAPRPCSRSCRSHRSRSVRDRRGLAVVHRHERSCGPMKKSTSRVASSCGCWHVDAVQHDVEVAGYGSTFGNCRRCVRILDRRADGGEDVGQDPQLARPAPARSTHTVGSRATGRAIPARPARRCREAHRRGARRCACGSPAHLVAARLAAAQPAYLAERRLRRGQPRHRDAERRAAHVVEPDACRRTGSTPGRRRARRRCRA